MGKRTLLVYKMAYHFAASAGQETTFFTATESARQNYGRAHNIKIRAKRYRCPHCGHLFREPIRGLKPHKRISENFKDSVAEKYLDCVANKRIFKAVVSLAKHCGSE